MKKFFIGGWIVMLALTVVLCTVGTGMATPKWVNAVPSYCQSNGNVTIPAMPKGTKLLNVVIYDDVQGTIKSLGPVNHFQLKPGQGFNFTWKDKTGVWWQMITPQSIAKGLVIDCSNPKGCKYLAPPAK
jgi:hypothetical protein